MTVGLTARGVGVKVDGRWLLRDVDLELAEGTLTVLVGPNGAGKSTLLDVLRGWRRPSAGEVRVADQLVHTLPPKTRAAHVAWLAQDPQFTDVVTVAEWLSAARFRFGESPRAARPAARQALDQVGMVETLDRLVPTLSGGEAQRVAIAALIAQQARIWLLDEPTHHLDPAAVRAVLEVVLTRFRDGQTMVVVAHHLDEITSVLRSSDHDRVRVVGLGQGQVRFERPAEDAEALASALSELYDVRLRAVTVSGRPRFVVDP